MRQQRRNTEHCAEAVSAHMFFNIVIIRETSALARETQGSEMRGILFTHSVINVLKQIYVY